jgi:CheY-like chemotaxis protein
LGHHLEIAPNGKVAVEMYQNNNYDIIFMDIQMPEMDGVEATKQIRQLELSEHAAQPTPIVAMTANTMKGDQDEFIKSGMNDCISKPFKIEQIIKILNTFVVGA